MTMVFGLAVLQLGLQCLVVRVVHTNSSSGSRLTTYVTMGLSCQHWSTPYQRKPFWCSREYAKTCTPSLLFKILESDLMSVVSFGWGSNEKCDKGWVLFCWFPLVFPATSFPTPPFVSKWCKKKQRPKTLRGWGSNKQIEWIRVAWWPTSHQTKCSLSLIETRSAKRAVFFSFRRTSMFVLLVHRNPSKCFCPSNRAILRMFHWWCVLGPVSYHAIFQRRSVRFGGWYLPLAPHYYVIPC